MNQVLPTQALMDLCLDAKAMAPRLAAVLPECVQGGWTVQRVKTDKVRRNASIHRNPIAMTLVYEVHLQHPHTQVHVYRSYYAKLFRRGACGEAREAQTSTLRLPELDLLLWAWPDDPALPQLAAMLSPRHADAWWDRRAHQVQVIRYEPEVRASLCYSTAPVDGTAHRLFAKTFTDARGHIILGRFRHFWDQAQGEPLAPLVAQPMGYCESTRTVWQAQAEGTPLTERLLSMDAAELRGLPSLLARTMAAVHQAPRTLLGDQVRDQPHWLREVQRRRKKISRVAPELAGLASDVAMRIEAAAPRLATPGPCVIHGDFHPDQVWLAGERAVLFDFDEFVLGDPMEDLAEFVTKLGREGRRGELGSKLVAAYARQLPDHFDPSRLRWHLAVQSLLQAARAFKFQRLAWRDDVRHHLERAAAHIDVTVPCDPEVMA